AIATEAIKLNAAIDKKTEAEKERLVLLDELKIKRVAAEKAAENAWAESESASSKANEETTQRIAAEELALAAAEARKQANEKLAEDAITRKKAEKNAKEAAQKTEAAERLNTEALNKRQIAEKALCKTTEAKVDALEKVAKRAAERTAKAHEVTADLIRRDAIEAKALDSANRAISTLHEDEMKITIKKKMPVSSAMQPGFSQLLKFGSGGIALISIGFIVGYHLRDHQDPTESRVVRAVTSATAYEPIVLRLDTELKQKPAK
ncbi:MAG: hypothetical protein WCL29_03230, partial [Pseudomonadota bacterium]